MLRIPGLGPKTVRLIYERARHRIARRPARGRRGGQRSATCAGLSERTEQLILEGIARLEATPERHAAPPGRGVDRRASPPPSPTLPASVASSRRARSGAGSETIGDLDLLAETDDGPGARSSGSPALGVGRRRRRTGAATRRRCGCCAARRSTSWSCRRARPARTSSTSPARRSTTSGSARWPATRAGACPSTASCASARTASR